MANRTDPDRTYTLILVSTICLENAMILKKQQVKNESWSDCMKKLGLHCSDTHYGTFLYDKYI